MKKSKKAILKALTEDSKEGSKFDMKVLNLALQKIDSDSFDFDGEAVYTVDHEAIIYCLSQGENFAIPDGVKEIGEMAFRHKTKLKNVIIPSTVTTIGNDAFYDCDALNNVFIPASVESIRGFAFGDCDALETITFGGVPKHLGSHSLDDCDVLHTVYVPKNSRKKFVKALHYDETEEYLIVERDDKDENK